MAASGSSGEISKLPPSQPWCLGICFTSRDSLLSPKALQLGTAYALRRMGFSAPLSLERKQPIAREASIHVMSVMSVLLSDYEFFEIYLILCFEYSPFIWRILLGNLYFPPPPFLSCHSPWMVVQRGGWWDGFDPHAHCGAEDQVSADVSPGARPQWKVLGIRLESRS